MPSTATQDPQATFAALKLFRVNQRTMVACDRIAIRSGDEPPARVRFFMQVDSAGSARVRVHAPGRIRPAVARCYRSLAASWRYPSTGRPYTLALSRISPRR